MQTIKEIAVECASKSTHPYTQVENFIPHNWVIEAMAEYGKQVAIAQRNACANYIEPKTVYLSFGEDLHESIKSI